MSHLRPVRAPRARVAPLPAPAASADGASSVVAERSPSPRAGASPLLYEPYYGLVERPFGSSADPRFFYKSRSHVRAFEQLLTGVRRRESVMVVTGDIGTGKTTLCRAVLAAVEPQTCTAVVPDPLVSREDFLKHVLLDFGVISVDELTRGRLDEASRSDLAYPLRRFLTSLRARDTRAVLVIDGAENLSLPLLEEIRVLSDFEEDGDKLLQIVLLGQLELRSLLRQSHMRLLDQRLAVRCELRPLAEDEVDGYITHRLGVAGGAPHCVTFSPDSRALIHATSGGVPRLLNLLCDRILQRGHAEGTSRIGVELVSRAIDDLEMTDLFRSAPDDALQFPSLPPKTSEGTGETAGMGSNESQLVELLRLSPSMRSDALPPTSGASSPAATADADEASSERAFSDRSARLWQRSWAWLRGLDEA